MCKFLTRDAVGTSLSRVKQLMKCIIGKIVYMKRGKDKTPTWRIRSITTSLTHVPALPGLYAIGHDETVAGLEVRRVYVYIGMSDNLRRRLSEHDPMREQKRLLKKYMKDNLHKVKCWYTTEVPAERLRSVEKLLIAEFDPAYNDDK